MSSGIVQLTAVGSQNEQITGNPEVSYFVSSYKRHSNFSQSLEEQTIQGAVNSGSSSKSVLINRVICWDMHIYVSHKTAKLKIRRIGQL